VDSRHGLGIATERKIKVSFSAGNGTSNFVTTEPVFCSLYYVIPTTPVVLHKNVILTWAVHTEKRWVMCAFTNTVRSGVTMMEGCSCFTPSNQVLEWYIYFGRDTRFTLLLVFRRISLQISVLGPAVLYHFSQLFLAKPLWCLITS
jgi:hypothetical protein